MDAVGPDRHATSKFLPTGGTAPSITSLNGHASHYQFGPPANDADRRSAAAHDDAPSPARRPRSTNRLVFSMGCHAGLSVADSIVDRRRRQHARLAAGVRAEGRRRLPRQHGLRLRRQPRRRVLGGAQPAVRAAHRGRLDRRQRARRREAGVLRRARRLRRLRREVDGGVHAVRPADVVGERAGQRAPAGVAATGRCVAAGVRRGAGREDAADGARPTPRRSRSSRIRRPASTPRRSASVRPPLRSPTTTNVTGDGKYWSARTACWSTHLRPIQPKAYVAAHRHDGSRCADHRADDRTTRTASTRSSRGRSSTSRRTRASSAFGDVAFPSKLQTVRTFQTPTGLDAAADPRHRPVLHASVHARTRTRSSASSGSSTTSPVASSGRRARTTSRRRSS